VRRRPVLVSLAAVGVLTLSACSDEAQTRPSGEVVGGNAGVDERVGDDLTVADVELEFPDDGEGYAKGDDADLYLAITNSGPADDTLVEVRAAEADSVGGDLPIDVPADDNVYVGAEGGPELVLEDLQTALRSSQSTEVTFVFENAGEVTVEVPVAASPRTDSDEDFSGVDGETGSEG